MRNVSTIVRRNEQLVLEVAELRTEMSRLKRENAQLFSHAKVKVLTSANSRLVSAFTLNMLTPSGIHCCPRLR